MALTGVQIYKFLPKTNCKECNFPTCLAFAMKLAAGGVELAACPYVSDEGKAALAAAAKPAIRLVTIGAGEKKIEVGNETVMFRHEKTFVHPTALVVRIKDTASADDVAKKVAEVSGYSVDRVGMTFGLDGFAVQNDSGDAAAFAKCVETVSSKSDLPLILVGYSFGAWTGLSAALQDDRMKGMVAIAPPLELYDFGFLEGNKKRKLLMAGDRDFFCPIALLKRWFENLEEPKSLAIIEGADHFFFTHHRLLIEPLRKFFKVISPPVTAAAIIKVPASILSGIRVCVKGFSSFTPLITRVSVPSPVSLAPIFFNTWAS